MEGFGEFVQIFGTGVTAGAVMGTWIWSLLQERNNNLTDWIFDEFTDEEQWIAELLVWGIVPDIDKEGNLIL